MFDWQTFVSLMKKPPKSILTNQDPWITEAISKELPLTKHASCIWHITAKFSGWLFFIVNIRVGAWISTSYISWTHVKNLSTNGYKLLQNMTCV